ncbi:MAG TPA: respiratory nitrate reductase subunit gamma [Myxococcales bacterium]|nr:respiratory nitrate reductase subunit gamma [Myxococcales bacterium]
MSNLFLFAVFPYLAVALAVFGGLYRWRRLGDTMSARSSQLLESRLQGFGAIPWHAAILVILLAHLLAAVFPHAFERLLGDSVRLYVLELTGLALGMLAVAGLAVLIARRFSLTASTSRMDWLVLLALLLQAASGVYIALVLRWGSGWFLHTGAPWLAALARFDPQVDRIVFLPFVVKLHFVNAFVLIALLPLTRLMHVVTIPISYLWRPPQLVSWRGSR